VHQAPATTYLTYLTCLALLLSLLDISSRRPLIHLVGAVLFPLRRHPPSLHFDLASTQTFSPGSRRERTLCLLSVAASSP